MLTPVSSSVSATSDIFQPQKIFFLSFCIFVFLLTFLFEIKVLKGHILPGFESEIIAEVFPRKEEKEKVLNTWIGNFFPFAVILV